VATAARAMRDARLADPVSARPEYTVWVPRRLA